LRSEALRLTRPSTLSARRNTGSVIVGVERGRENVPEVHVVYSLERVVEGTRIAMCLRARRSDSARAPLSGARPRMIHASPSGASCAQALLRVARFRRVLLRTMGTVTRRSSSRVASQATMFTAGTRCGGPAVAAHSAATRVGRRRTAPPRLHHEDRPHVLRESRSIPRFHAPRPPLPRPAATAEPAPDALSRTCAAHRVRPGPRSYVVRVLWWASLGRRGCVT
jgi:hypothetical protein